MQKYFRKIEIFSCNVFDIAVFFVPLHGIYKNKKKG